MVNSICPSCIAMQMQGARGECALRALVMTYDVTKQRLIHIVLAYL